MHILAAAQFSSCIQAVYTRKTNIIESFVVKSIFTVVHCVLHTHSYRVASIICDERWIETKIMEKMYGNIQSNANGVQKKNRHRMANERCCWSKSLLSFHCYVSLRSSFQVRMRMFGSFCVCFFLLLFRSPLHHRPFSCFCLICSKRISIRDSGHLFLVESRRRVV